MDQHDVRQGASLPIEVTVRDADGEPVTTYTGSEPLAAVLWPGGNFPTSCTPAAAWAEPAAALIAVDVGAAQTAALAPGRYQLRVLLADGGATVEVYAAAVAVAPSPGSEPLPATYCSYADLLTFGKGWLRALETGDDGAGFLRERGEARRWVEDCAHAHYRVAAMAPGGGGQGAGPRRSGARSSWLQQQLDADRLMVTGQVRELAALKALELVCQGRVDGDPAHRYARLADFYGARAACLAASTTLQIDADGDGLADAAIDLSCTDTLYG